MFLGGKTFVVANLRRATRSDLAADNRRMHCSKASEREGRVLYRNSCFGSEI